MFSTLSSLYTTFSRVRPFRPKRCASPSASCPQASLRFHPRAQAVSSLVWAWVHSCAEASLAASWAPNRLLTCVRSGGCCRHTVALCAVKWGATQARDSCSASRVAIARCWYSAPAAALDPPPPSTPRANFDALGDQFLRATHVSRAAHAQRHPARFSILYQAWTQPQLTPLSPPLQFSRQSHISSATKLGARRQQEVRGA